MPENLLFLETEKRRGGWKSYEGRGRAYETSETWSFAIAQEQGKNIKHDQGNKIGSSEEETLSTTIKP